MSPVVKPNEILLNSIRYPLVSKVRPELTSVWPAKMVTGDYSKDTDPIASTWAVSDQRGGILVEELEEQLPEHKYKCWWSTCNLGFRGNITLPPLATTTVTVRIGVVNGNMEAASGGWNGGARTTDHVYSGTYCWTVTGAATAYLDVPWDDSYQGEEFVFTCSAWHDAGSEAKISINDGVTTTDSGWHTGGSTFEKLTATKTLAANATRLRLILNCSGIGTTPDFDDAQLASTNADIIIGTVTAGTTNHWIEFNGKLYIAMDTYLCRLNAAGTFFDDVKQFGADITALIQNGTNLFVLTGDAEEYWYMSTSEVFAKTDEADATKGIWWDTKLLIFDSAGACQFTTTPAQASPGMAARGSLPIADNELQTVFAYRDTSGNDVVYCSTKVGLFSHDYANSKFLHTELKVPNHPTAGKGAVVWHSACFVSAGLATHRYVAAATADISLMGLERDDGLPQLRGGEIVKFIEGYNEFFALVDSTYEGTTSRSTVMAYDGKGWQCWWEATADNKNMYSGIVSTAFAYRLWFSTTDGIYYIPIQRVLRKPKKITGFTYASAGVHITPWFDANWPDGEKLALTFRVKTSGCSADEDVIVRYRIDHAKTDLATGWTLLGTIESDTVTEYGFASDVGVAFKSIQFRFELASGTSTLSPNIEWFTLSYLKNLTSTAGTIVRWGYRFTVDCTKEYDGRSPGQLLTAIKAAAEVSTLIDFYYTESTTALKGRIRTVEGEEQTGEDEQGHYQIFFVVL